jgi:hypothetical protein
MGLDGDEVEDVASAGSDIVTAGVGASVWSNNKLLLAVLPPTLALLSVGLGVWQNTRSEANDNKLAREARAEEAAEEQAAIARDQDIRIATLVLPRYEALLSNVRATMAALDQCSNDIDRWNNPDVGLGADIGQAPPMFEANEDGTTTASIGVGDAEFLTSCPGIEATLAPLVVSLDQALLVSEPTLEATALRLEEELVVAARTAKRIGTAALGDQILLVEDETGRTFFDYVAELEASLARADEAANDVVAAVRGVLLDDEG